MGCLALRHRLDDFLRQLATDDCGSRRDLRENVSERRVRNQAGGQFVADGQQGGQIGGALVGLGVASVSGAELLEHLEQREGGSGAL